MPQYLVLIYGEEQKWDEATPEWRERSDAGHRRFGAEAGAAVLGGRAPAAAKAATSPRVDALGPRLVLADGGTGQLRPLRPDDGDRLVTFFHRWSPETVYRRFFTVRSDLTASEVDRFVNVDHHDRVAIVAELSGQMVAVARYDRLPDS